MATGAGACAPEPPEVAGRLERLRLAEAGAHCAAAGRRVPHRPPHGRPRSRQQGGPASSSVTTSVAWSADDIRCLGGLLLRRVSDVSPVKVDQAPTRESTRIPARPSADRGAGSPGKFTVRVAQGSDVPACGRAGDRNFCRKVAMSGTSAENLGATDGVCVAHVTAVVRDPGGRDGVNRAGGSRRLRGAGADLASLHVGQRGARWARRRGR